MFAAIERRTGAAPVTDALTDLLQRGTDARAVAISWAGAALAEHG
jgi:hypothetical protein